MPLRIAFEQHRDAFEALRATALGLEPGETESYEPTLRVGPYAVDSISRELVGGVSLCVDSDDLRRIGCTNSWVFTDIPQPESTHFGEPAGPVVPLADGWFASEVVNCWSR